MEHCSERFNINYSMISYYNPSHCKSSRVTLDVFKLSVQQAYNDFFRRNTVEEQCTEESLIRLHETFMIFPNGEMDESQLQNAFENVLNFIMPKEDFNILFRKIDFDQNGRVTWDEFISYLLLEIQEKDTVLQRQTLELPITGTPQTIRSHHRTPICRIIFCPEVLPDRSTSFQSGYYATISKDGLLNFWSLDLQYERSAQSVNPYLKIQGTVITDMIVMPDIQILCTSSTECDLRFYDIAAKKFDLRMMISRFEHAVVCMDYYFNKDIKEDSYIILGDMDGSVRIIHFNSIDKGPFKQKPGRDVIILRYETLLKGEVNGMKVIEIKNVHTDWVSQVAYYGSLEAFMSSSTCSNCSLLFSDPTSTRIQYKFRVNMGILCFSFCEESQTLVTGGADCIVRVWNPFVPMRPNVVFQGHHASICALVIQNYGKRIYSLSKDKCIKVWDVLAQCCIQTYNGLPNEIGEQTSLTIVYNSLNHKIIIASMIIAVVICEPVINEETSDGFTHTKQISCILYNHLYKLIATTGFDSYIIVWDPWHGRRLCLITNAHSKLLYGQYYHIEITAACFDDSEQLLLTGARDGTLKIWNFNTGTCIRSIIVEYQCEVTSIVCFENRILCSSWNRQVVEFALSDSDTCRKSWGAKHTDDILCSAVWYPQMLATGTYNGELILWRLETGQPFRKYKVDDVTARYNVISNTRNHSKQTRVNNDRKNKHVGGRRTDTGESILNGVRTVAIRAILFLTARTVASNVGTLLVSLDSGLIQVWSHHPAGGFLQAFSVIHAAGDCALSLATDPENHFLVTGHKIGYIKVWLLANYLLPNSPEMLIPFLRLEFPFLWKDRILGRAKRAVRDQPLPLLLSSLRGHTKAITCIQIIPQARIIISGSADCTVRLWTLGGCYMATLGTFRTWVPVLSSIPAHKYFKDSRYPPDIKRTASFTTMKVLRTGILTTEHKRRDDVTHSFKTVDHENALQKAVITPPILNKFLESGKCQANKEVPVLDSSLADIPIYTHLNVNIFDVTVPPIVPGFAHKVHEKGKSIESKTSRKPTRLNTKVKT